MISITVISFLLVAGCNTHHTDYRGEHPELYTVALNSWPGAISFCKLSRGAPTTDIMEEDDYGRVLFFYPLNSLEILILYISQTSDDEYVWFYPHYSFYAYKAEDGRFQGFPSFSKEKFLGSFPAEEIEEFKRRNDWNEEMDLSKAVRVPIETHIKLREGPINNEHLTQTHLEILGPMDNERVTPSLRFFMVDDYGRSLYQGNRNWGKGDDIVFRSVMVLFQADGSYEYLELADSILYDQTELREFKEQNGWNQPY